MERPERTEGDPRPEEPRRTDEPARDREPRRADEPARDREPDRDAPPSEGRERARAEFGGFSLGTAILGWLAAVGLGALLVALLSAAGTAIGLTEVTEADAEAEADTISLIGAVLLIVVVALAYYVGGYVAGRLARFDGGRHGFGVWAIGLVVTLLLAALGAVAEAEYNLLAELELPRIPIEEGDLATGGAITLALVLITSAAAAVLGGKLGERYHLEIDRAVHRPR
jgi:hypothetical protein